MNSVDLLAKIYKPYNIIVKGNVQIFKCTSGNYTIKKKSNADINKLYKYLNSRSFKYYPKLISDNRSEVNVYEYIADVSLDSEQKLYDLVNLVSLLHNKTSYYKEITKDKIKEIYENLLGRVEYLESNLNDIIFKSEDNIFVSPSNNLILNNSNKVFEMFTFLKQEIDSWYRLSENDTKIRVCLVHNNLELEHYLKNEDEYLISWDNYIIDTPIIDIVKLYKKIYLTTDFSEAIKIYLEKMELNEKEKKLLIIMLVMPEELILTYNNEIRNVYLVRKYLDYIFKTENLIKPYFNT